MKDLLIKINAYIKGLVIFLKPHVYLGWSKKFLQKISNTLYMSEWITKQNKDNILDDFYTSKRVHSKRYELYDYIIDKISIQNEAINYLEFGVFQGHSFRWWCEKNKNLNSRFYGFDTFSGLPEDWDFFSKGDMAADSIPVIDDNRVEFIKGLFQDTVQDFISNHNMNDGKRKVIHMDADLFSSTLFILTTLAHYFKKGDIIFFDEFNVPNHEFLAFKYFCDAFYTKIKLIGAVNNYYQVAFIIE